jgi:hypothetical protein
LKSCLDSVFGAAVDFGIFFLPAKRRGEEVNLGRPIGCEVLVEVFADERRDKAKRARKGGD